MFYEMKKQSENYKSVIEPKHNNEYNNNEQSKNMIFMHVSKFAHVCTLKTIHL